MSVRLVVRTLALLTGAACTADVSDAEIVAWLDNFEPLGRSAVSPTVAGVSQAELTTALTAAFPNMPAWAMEHLPQQYEKYATGEGEARGLDSAAFSKLYAAFLFRYFDASQDGMLQVDECEKALAFLTDGKPTAVAVPVGENGVVSKLDFWLSTRSARARVPRGGAR